MRTIAAEHADLCSASSATSFDAHYSSRGKSAGSKIMCEILLKQSDGLLDSRSWHCHMQIEYSDILIAGASE